MAGSVLPACRSSLGAALCLATLCIVLSAQQTSATRFVVGDASGWTSFDPKLQRAPDYTAWAAHNPIFVNDTLLFNMPAGGHTLIQLFTPEALATCNFTDARQWANVTDVSFEARLTEPGYYFFSCWLPSHCPSGQKLSIIVHDHAVPPPQLSPIGAPPPAHAHAPGPAASAPPPASFPGPHTAPVGAPKMSPTAAPAGHPVHSPLAAPHAAPAGSPLGSPFKAPAPGASPPHPSNTTPAPEPSTATNGAPGSVASGVVILLMSVAALMMV